MSMQKLREIRRGGTYTAQRGVAERLLDIEPEIRKNEELHQILKTDSNMRIPKIRKIVREQTKEKLTENNIQSLHHDQFRQYLQITSGKGYVENISDRIRGAYMSELFHYLTGDQPFEIDLENKKSDWFFFGLNSKRPISIKNLHGQGHFWCAGGFDGEAHITAQNLRGGNQFSFTGTERGKVIINAQHISEGWNFSYSGAYHGTAHINAQHISGNDNFNSVGAQGGKTRIVAQYVEGHNQLWGAGSFNGESVIVAKEVSGATNLKEHKGILVLYNTTPKSVLIKGIYNPLTYWNIRKIISQDGLPEQIMAYLRGST